MDRCRTNTRLGSLGVQNQTIDSPAASLPAALPSQQQPRWSYPPRCCRRRPRPSQLHTDQPPQPAVALSPELQAEGELKYQWIIQTYGKRLNEEQKQDLHRLVMEGQKPLAAFRAFPLELSLI